MENPKHHGKKAVASDWRQSWQRLKWALPAFLVIFPLNQICGYAVARGAAPSWFYLVPVLYCFTAMIAIFLLFRGEVKARHRALKALSTHGGRSLAHSQAHENTILQWLALLLACGGVFIPLLRGIKLIEPGAVLALHYTQVLLDAGFIFVVLISMIDLCSGIFFDTDSESGEDDDRIAASRASAISAGYLTVVLGMSGLYLLGQFHPQWCELLLPSLIALVLIVPIMVFVLHEGHTEPDGRHRTVKCGYVIAILGLGMLHMYGQFEPLWCKRLLLPLLAVTLLFRAMAQLRRSKQRA